MTVGEGGETNDERRDDDAASERERTDAGWAAADDYNARLRLWRVR